MKKLLTLFFLIMFTIGTDTFLISPLLPLLRHQFRVSMEMAGWLVGAYAIGYALFALVAGPLSDGWNRKRVMLWGLTAFSLANLVGGLSTGFWWMFAFRLLAGVSASFVSPNVWAAIASVLPAKQRVKGMGIATTGLSLAQVMGVPLGGMLAALRWNAPFFALSLGTILLILLVRPLLPDLLPSADQGQHPSVMARYRGLMANPTAKLGFLAFLIFQTGNFGAFTFVGAWLHDAYGLQTAEIAFGIMAVGIGTMVGSLTAGIAVRKLGQSLYLSLAIFLWSVAYLVLPHMPSVIWAEIGLFFTFSVGGGLYPVMMSVLQELSASARGTIASVANSAMYAGTMIGAAAAGLLYSSWRFAVVGGFAAACGLAALVLFYHVGAIHRVWPTRMRQASR